MFLGEHQHSLDAKGRVILPARFRDQLEDGAVFFNNDTATTEIYTLSLHDALPISLDGFGTGEPQSREAPFGHAGERLHEWMFTTGWWHEMVGDRKSTRLNSSH